MLDKEKKNDFFAVDESLFGQVDGNQFWMIGIINNKDRDFQIEPTFTWNIADLKNFISKYVAKGNSICTNGWAG